MNEHNTDPLQSIACRSRRTAAAAAQRPRREAEEAVRHHTAAVCDAMRQSGHRACRVAAEIRLSPRTLGRWRRRYRQQKSPPPRGRPAMESSLPQRREAVAWIDHEGPHIGLPTLRATFPHMPRAELRDLQADYRRYYRLTHRAPVEELRWQRPGRVWAVDHAEPLAPIDGVYAAILSVRDLASGMQLAWQPVVNQGAESAQAVLRRLFVVHGPPLVLKSDNGSAFKDAGTQAVLSTEKIVWLPSPPRTPKYNGGCEAGNGSMKMRTRFFVHRNGRLHHWAAADLEAARRQANDLARPSGHLAPTPAQRWAARSAITDDERCQFIEAVGHQRALILEKSADHFDLSNRNHQHQVLRQAVRRALLDVGLLTITRRSIPLPIKRKKGDTHNRRWVKARILDFPSGQRHRNGERLAGVQGWQ